MKFSQKFYGVTGIINFFNIHSDREWNFREILLKMTKKIIFFKYSQDNESFVKFLLR
jgi:hypothetical protein